MERTERRGPLSHFRIRILIPFLLLDLALILGLWLPGSRIVSTMVEARSRDNLDQIIDKTLSQVDAAIAELDKFALFITANPGIAETFRSLVAQAPASPDGLPFALRRRALTDVMLPIYALRSPPSRISVFNDRGDYLSMGLPDQRSAIDSVLGAGGFPAWYHAASAPRLPSFAPAHLDRWSDDRETHLVSDFRGIRDFETGALFALVEVQADIERFRDYLGFGQELGLSAWILDGTGQVMLRPAPLPAGASRLEPFLKEASSGPLPSPVTERAGFMVSSRVVALTGWRLVFAQPLSVYRAPLVLTSRLVLLVGLGALLVSALSVFLIAARVAKPLLDLTRSIREVSMENLAVQLDSGGQDEVIQLERAFGGMFARLQVAMDESVQARAREMNAQLLALQAQMNPHFIFNTLQVIAAAGQETGNMKVVRMCGRLSKLIRYSSVFEETPSTLAEEIEHTRTYLELMGERYESLLTWSADCDPELGGTHVPRLSIQPLVENCFVHAFVAAPPPWSLGVHARAIDAERFEIEVRDEGSGIGPGRLAELRGKIQEYERAEGSYLRSLRMDHVGLLNTFVRFRILHGERASLSLESRPGETYVRLRGSRTR